MSWLAVEIVLFFVMILAFSIDHRLGIPALAAWIASVIYILYKYFTRTMK